MTSRTRRFVLAVSVPVIAFAVIGGYLGQAFSRDDTYKHLTVFEDVISIVLNNYVEEVDVNRAMEGALQGLSDALDADSEYITTAQVQTMALSGSAEAAEVGIELIRQYYLRVVSVRDGSPADREGIRTGDFIRVIDDRATRNMTTFEGTRLLKGAPGSTVSLVVIRGNATEPHVVDLVREHSTGPDVTSRITAPGIGYVRILEFSASAVAGLTQAVTTLEKAGATRFVIDLRGTARGELEQGVAAARLFVKTGILSVRQGKGDERETVRAADSEGNVTAPVVLLTDPGTSGAAEVFAAALNPNDRATRVGQRTLGRTARQRLVPLPDGSGLWLSYQRYLTPAGEPLHQQGLAPDVEVEVPITEFGAAPPPGDPAMDKAIEQLTEKKAA
jgi:carboxyl-terminal processing protease